MDIVDSPTTKESVYGKYEFQNEVMADILSSLERLKIAKTGEKFTMREMVDYFFLTLKMVRSVTSSDNPHTLEDSLFDLSNYSRLICRRRTGRDFAYRFKEIYENEKEVPNG